MKRLDMHTFTSSFDGVKNISSKNHKDILKKALMAEITSSHAGYRKDERKSSFLHTFFLCMKNIKVAGATAAVAAIATLGTIFAPNVLAYSAVYSGLGTISTLSAQEVEATYKVDIVDFENSLTAAKKSWDLRTVSKKEAIEILKKSNVTIGKTMIGENMTNEDSGAILVDVNMENSNTELLGDGSAENPYHSATPISDEDLIDSRVTQFVRYTNESGEKVLLGLDKDNLPILMSISQ